MIPQVSCEEYVETDCPMAVFEGYTVQWFKWLLFLDKNMENKSKHEQFQGYKPYQG